MAAEEKKRLTPADMMSKGCCGGDVPVNFSLMMLPNHLDVDFTDSVLWWAILVIFIEPLFKPLFGVLEYRREFFSRYLGKNLTFIAYITASYVYSMWTFYFIQKTISSQPSTRDLHRNEALMTGYLFILTGLAFKFHTYRKQGVTTIMGGEYFKLSSSLKGKCDPYYHPVGTASVMCYFGCSLIRASMAGVLLAACMGVAYIMAHFVERLHLQASVIPAPAADPSQTKSLLTNDMPVTEPVMTDHSSASEPKPAEESSNSDCRITPSFIETLRRIVPTRARPYPKSD